MEVKITADKQSPQPSGTSVKLSARAEGGKGTLQYRFYYLKGGEVGILRDYDVNPDAYCNLTAGDYKIYVDVKDESGKKASASIDYRWEDAGSDLKITEILTDKASPQLQGTSVKLTVKAEGGKGKLQYRFYRVKDGSSKVFREYSTSNTAYCNPVSGTYTIYVDVKDNDGTVVTKELSYTWEAKGKLTIKSLKASKVSPQPKGTSICFMAEAEGGSGNLQYRFTRTGNGKTAVIRDYGSGAKAYCNPPTAGDYTICVEVKDEAGNTAKESLAYSWSAPSQKLELENVTASKASPQPKGTSICFTANAKGGDGELQYRFYRVYNGTVTIFRDFTTSNKAYCNPAAAGSYTIYVDVKDRSGNIVTNKLAYVWK